MLEKAGISCFLTHAKRKGYAIVRREQKLGHRSNDTCQIALENFRIDARDMLGKPGRWIEDRTVCSRYGSHWRRGRKRWV